MKILIKKPNFGMEAFRKFGFQVEITPQSEKSLKLIIQAMKHFYPDIPLGSFSNFCKIGNIGSSIYIFEFLDNSGKNYVKALRIKQFLIDKLSFL
jgi:hypothetical protein